MEQRFSKKDYVLALISGFFTGLFLLPVLANVDVAIPQQTLVMLAGFPLLMFFGLLIGGMLSRWFSAFFQLSKFAATGFLNAAIDFGILNGFLFLIGISSGYLFVLFKAFSFIAANINSYFWNKFWTFRRIPSHTEEGALEQKKLPKEYIQFLTVSLIGLALNVGAASLVVNGIGPQFGIGANGWANIGAAFGSAAGLLWNFIGYKLIVFRA